ncbi:MAG: FKBP-type peptidyl-prolyl cis-trans isomerase [Puniceicoccales bacterium]|jgi:FKBP-type peptidyl-prolyl cis-trans isomerase|nr:FKBP-type peptidyl-prolyl cis-trans isomerase [Puniceicoccales bacterium]
MMDNWKDLFVVSTLYSGLSLHALEPVVVEEALFASLPEAPAKNVLSTTVGQNTQHDRHWQAYGQFIFYNTGLTSFGLTAQEFEQIIAGMKSALNGENPILSTKEEINKMQQFLEDKEKEQVANNKKLGDVFLKAKLAEQGFQKTPSGVVYKIIQPGNAKRANDDSNISIDYIGKSTNGKVFESTYERNEKAVVYVGSLVPGFSEIVKLIGEGGEVQAFIPPDLAYGDETVGPIPGGSVLDFSIKVHEIIQPMLKIEEPKGIDLKTLLK